MRVASAVLVATLAAAGGTGSVTSRSEAQVGKSPPAVLGITYKPTTVRGDAWHGVLGWFDPLTLRALPGRKAPLGSHSGSWAFSADRSVLAIARCNVSRPEIRFVNARAMRVLGDLELSPYPGCAGSLAWLRPDRLLALLHAGDASEVVVVDPSARRVLRRAPLPAAPWTVTRLQDGLALRLSKEEAIGPAQVAVVDVEGNVRTRTVDGVLAGSIIDDSVGYRVRTVSPGFAVDPDGRRAFLVPASGPVAEVDLRTLEVSYHDLDPPSLLGRFLRWLTPTAEAKQVEGPVRYARWLGDGVLAVSGMDYSLSRNAAGEEVDLGAPAGVKLVDTRSWRTRMLSPQSSSFVLAPGLVIAEGGHRDGDGRTVGPGLIAFGPDWNERWRLPQVQGWLDPLGSLGYGYLWLADGRCRIIDFTTGTVLSTLKRNVQENQFPSLLAAQSSFG